MICLRKSLLIFAFLFLIIPNNYLSQEIGKSWEFNEAGNFEGIIIGNSFQDSRVENSYLKATVSGSFPSISSEPFELESSDYGFIQIRMKIPGASSGKIMWNNDSGNWGFYQFISTGDSSFQEFDIPVYLSNQWVGKITQIRRLDFNPKVGSQVEIDYIRIVRKGVQPTITNFKPFRTVIKQNVEIPLFAALRNEGDIETELSSKLILPNGVTLVGGSLENDHGIIFKEITDTLNWNIIFENLGEHELTLKVFNETDTTAKIISLNVTDQYWTQNKFFLSAWSPPSLTTEAYDYYANANFDMVLWLPPDEVSVAKAEENEMEYILRAGSLIGEHDYLRAPDNIVPEDLTQDDLTKLDGMIEQFKDREKVLGYYLTDEPNAKAFPNLGKAVNYLRGKDPTRLSFINLFPNYASDEQFGTSSYDDHIEQYLDFVKPELLSYDHYHFFNTYDGSGYFSNLGIIRKWALNYDIPFCNIIQAIGTNGTTVDFLGWRIPNEAEHRWLVYSSLTYGAKAIVWFHWDHSWGLTSSPERDTLYASIQQLNQEMNNLGDILINLESRGVYHSKTTSGEKLPVDGIVKSVSEENDLIIGYFKDKNADDYFMLMNKDYSKNITSEVTLNYILDSLQYFNVDENKWEDLLFENSNTGATISLPLKAGGGKLIKFKGETIVGLSEANTAPTQIDLKQNYPNPFNPSTKIKYSIPVDTHIASTTNVVLKVYDILGCEVATLVNEQQKPGHYQATWDASKFSSGLYFYRLKAEKFLQSKKMMYLK